MKTKSTNVFIAALLLCAASAAAAEPPAIRAALQPGPDRKPAPAFRLGNADGKKTELSDLRGKVVLLDFWATECGGCVREIPWFMDLARAYEKKGLAVRGVSVDVMYEDLKDSREGWARVKPFVQTHRLNYPVLMADDAVTKSFDIKALPLTYLIDKRGRIAATYIGIVDKENLEANIQAVLNERSR
ncbi:MAG TPA: TlpA disulfide reductase family protein [Bryobacteraceae bacterium]